MNLLNFLTEYWKILGDNSGQFQTIAAFIGLGLATYALMYSKKQIAYSQTERRYSLKIQVSSEFFSLLEKIETTLNKIRIIKEIEIDKCKDIHNEEFNKRINVLVNSLKVTEDNLKSTKESLESFHTSFLANKSHTSLNELENIIDNQIKIQEGILDSLHTINRIEIIVFSIQYDIEVQKRKAPPIIDI
ncbi:hypothetical protein [Acinetobacter baumannii]|uniref:hypothetical protein n=1 Tax=Acinetobacter baumannii TaxID=470 RepID=UPI00386235AA|nr:hypothetical protein [Acinetobacter baumannii]